MPASKIAKQGYDAYGKPPFENARKYIKKQWQNEIIPRLHSAWNDTNDIYRSKVEPYVQRFLSTVAPYSADVSSKVIHVNDNYVMPIYLQSKPLVSKTYSSVHGILVGTIMPLAQRTWYSAIVFANSAVWPQVTGLYSENIEPQLVKIGEKLASYREGRKLRAVIDEVDSAIDETLSTVVIPHLEDVKESKIASPTSGNDVVVTETPLSPSQQIAQAREKVTSDLRKWQQKFAVAADKGVEDLGERIEEIVSSHMKSGAQGHGKTLTLALKTVVDHEISNLKTHIIPLTESLPTVDAPQQEEEAKDELLKAIRSAGLAIRDRAHALREWYNSFEEELHRRVFVASESTLDVLDGIRDLGLQEIGMRWAWMDGVTYKDWANYHALRRQFEDWRNEIRDFGLHHDKVEEARELASDILSEGMIIAEDAAKELTRLREVGKWKIEARDTSDNFDTRNERPPPLAKSDTTTTEHSISISNNESKNTRLQDASHSVTPESDSPTDIIAAASNEQTQVTLHNGILPQEEIISDTSYLTSKRPDAQAAGNKVWGGAVGQDLPEQSPVLEDSIDDTEQRKFSDQMQNIANQVSDRYAEATKVVSEALFGPSPTGGIWNTAATVAGDRYSHPLSATSIVLDSSPVNDGGQFAGVAAEKYKQAVAAASAVLFGSPVGVIKSTSGPLASISSIASSRLHEGLSMASAQYANVKASILPTPTAAHDPILLDARRRYYEAIGLAHDHYSAFVDSASRAVLGTPTPTPPPGNFHAILDDATSQYKKASSLASASLAAVVASATSASKNDAHDLVKNASAKYSAAISAASSSFSVASASISSALYGTSKGSLESIASKASENWDSLVSKASEQIYGTPTPYIQQLLDQQASQYKALESLVSELLAGKEPPFTDSVMSKLREAYETPYPISALSSASTYASDAYKPVSSLAAAYITPLLIIENVLSSANEKLESAVDAASIYVYGPSKGTYAQITSTTADFAYATASSQVSEALHRTQTPYVSVARGKIDEASSSAQSAISSAIYGTPIGPVESVLSAASSVYASVTSAAGDNIFSASSIMNSAHSNFRLNPSSPLHNEQQGALESATSRLVVAVENAQSRLADLALKASDHASQAMYPTISVAKDPISVSSASSRSKDEL